MCLGSFWTALQILWCSIYVVCGTVQLIAGIFFLISVPLLNFSIYNVVASFVSILMGVISGTIVCFGKWSPRRQEILLYVACSVLIINLTSTILREWNLYFQDLTEITRKHPQQLLILYGCFVVRITATAVIVASFLDSQFAFCSMQIRSKDYYRNDQRNRGVRRNTRSQDSLADIEYIIHRKSSTKSPSSKPHAIYNAYAQNWVFESDLVNSSNNLAACTKQSSSDNSSPKDIKQQQTTHLLLTNGDVQVQQPNKNASTSVASATPPIIVQIDEISDDSDSFRKLSHMKSFSRATSPAQLSTNSSQVSLNSNLMRPPIHEYLERLTESEVYRSRLNSALSDRTEHNYNKDSITMRRVESVSPQSEKVLYASFMQELQKAIVDKKECGSENSSSSSSSKSKSKSKNPGGESEDDDDGKFSRELEAALQLIQDLESPNNATVANTPSSVVENAKTVAGADLNSSEFRTFKPTDFDLQQQQHSRLGKGVKCNVVNSSSSQSTSGYSSPNHTTPTWSTTSSINNEIIQPPQPPPPSSISYSIHNSNKHTTVISLYTPSNCNSDNRNNNQSVHQKHQGKSVTLVSINGDVVVDDDQTKPSSGTQCQIDKDPINVNSVDKNNQSNSNGWKSLLRKKSPKPPKLCPELEGAIVKSESLAYLTDVELLARHQRNNEMHRKIEERVIQQLGVPRSESKC